MKKLLFPLLLAVASLSVAHAQNRSITVQSDGTVLLNNSTIGQIKSDGTVLKNNSTIGQIKSDGTVLMNNLTVGQIKSDGTILINNSTVGHESSMSRNEIAARYFFFK